MSTPRMNRRRFVQSAGLTMTAPAIWSTVSHASQSSESDRPNILWITCEDISPHLGCYTAPDAFTPHLDQLALEGVRYMRAYANASVCTPARSSIITGVYASTLGTQHLRGIVPLSSSMRCFTKYLRDAGYYCSNSVKEDYNFQTPSTAWDESSTTAHWRKKKSNQPFFSVFNFTLTHQSKTRYPAEQLAEVSRSLAPEERHAPDRVHLPPYYPDTPEVRINVAALHTQITLMDKKVKEILDQLEEDGLAENTIVFFYSDHGDGLPRGKRWLHDTGTRVPFIVRFPEKYRHLAPAEPGSTIERMITFTDLAPTVLHLAGLPIPSYMQGTPFLGEDAGKEHSYVFGIRDRIDEVLELSRSVRDKRYHYIRNFYPHRSRMQRSFFSEITPIRRTLRELDVEGKLNGHERWLMNPTTPPEELYDTENDPYELNNLIDSPQHRPILKRLRKTLLQWILETRDTAFLPEVDMIQRSRGGSPYDMAQDGDRYPIERVVNIANLIGEGPSACEKFSKALGDSDSAVRYWAANGLAALGKDARPALSQLRKALRDASSSVRFAAAEALCNLNIEKEAVPVLAKGLEDADVMIQLHASQILSVIGEKARPAIPQMKSAVQELEGLQDHGLYTRENLAFVLKSF